MKKFIQSLVFVGFLAIPVSAQDLGSYRTLYAYDDATRLTQFTVNGTFTHRFDYGDGGVILRYVVGPTASVDIEPSEDGTLPTRVALHDAYPNPFNPSTSIRFDLPEARAVSIEVFDLLGRIVSKLVEGTLPAGYHQVNWNASGFGSGSYLVRLVAGNVVQTRTVVLVK